MLAVNTLLTCRAAADSLERFPFAGERGDVGRARAAFYGDLNRPGFRGGCLVKVKPGIRSSRQVADSSFPQPRLVEYTQSAPATGGG